MPELLEPWTYQPVVVPIDPSAEEGLDLTTPVGRIVEIAILSITEPPFGAVQEAIEVDTGLLFAVGAWRLLVESLAHTDHYLMGSEMDLVLSTGPGTIDERLAKGRLRRIDGRSTS
jgi:hypothetical protein